MKERTLLSSEIVAHTGSTILADLSLGMLRQASCKNGMIPLCSLTESLPFPDESFDRVIMIDALHHLYSHSKTANELWRVIKPGGRIVIEEPNIHKPAVWVVAILEKLAFMRSHIISSGKISNLFKDPKAKVISEQQGYAIWIIIQKI